MKPLTSTDKKKIIEQLNKQFGITELPYLLLQFGHDRIRLYSGNLSKEELGGLDKNLRVENIGLYFATFENHKNKFRQDRNLFLNDPKSIRDFGHEGIRLTIDGVQLLKAQITKNIIELDKKQAEDWMKGNDLDIKTERGWKILRFENELIGCGKSSSEKIGNFMPKERRVR